MKPSTTAFWSGLALFAIASISTPANADPASDRNAAEVRDVLATYKAAIERLDMRGTERLFTPDSRIFESGGDEGSYTHYLEHHLGPEFAEFKTFRFNDYKIEVRFEGPVAITIETYGYRIVPKAGAPADRIGVQTSVLKQTEAGWQVINMHSSSRKPPK